MSKLYIKQKVFSLGEKFTVKDRFQQDKYFIEGSFMSIPKVFTIKDVKGKPIGKITKKIFSFLPKFFVEVDGKEVLTISKSLTLFKTHYQIDMAGLEVHGDWWDKIFKVTKESKVVAEVDKKWFTWGDTFEVAIHEAELEHIIIALVIAIDFVKQEEVAAVSSGATT